MQEENLKQQEESVKKQESMRRGVCVCVCACDVCVCVCMCVLLNFVYQVCFYVDNNFSKQCIDVSTGSNNIRACYKM